MEVVREVEETVEVELLHCERQQWLEIRMIGRRRRRRLDRLGRT